jgi:hypothetical protein
MAKLEDLVTPSEILEMIKGGMLKTELIKRYRTSEQELALMLLPLHRGGELTKEEFNNFFKGIPLSPPEILAPAEVNAAPSHEPNDKPAEAIRSPQKIVGKKPANDLAEPREIAVQNGPEAVHAPQAEPMISPPSARTPAAEVQKESASVTEALQTILDRLDSIDHHLSEIERKLGFN